MHVVNFISNLIATIKSLLLFLSFHLAFLISADEKNWPFFFVCFCCRRKIVISGNHSLCLSLLIILFFARRWKKNTQQKNSRPSSIWELCTSFFSSGESKNRWYNNRRFYYMLESSTITANVQVIGESVQSICIDERCLLSIKRCGRHKALISCTSYTQTHIYTSSTDMDFCSTMSLNRQSTLCRSWDSLEVFTKKHFGTIWILF